MTTDIQPGRLYLVGVGPGDPELMTCKAARILEQTKIWVAPKAKKNGNSNALHIAAAQVGVAEKTVLELRFPMVKVHLGHQPADEVVQAWQEAAAVVWSHLEQGDDVAFPTLGDPALYSTAFYLLDTLQGHHPDARVTIIPGRPPELTIAFTTSLTRIIHRPPAEGVMALDLSGEKRADHLPMTVEGGKSRTLSRTGRNGSRRPFTKWELANPQD